MKRTALVSLIGLCCLALLAPPRAAAQDGLIPYRQLTRANFKGSPAPFSSLQAYTEAGIMWDWRFTTTVRDDGRYECTLSEIRYEAYFDENGSWWKGDGEDANILRHEQGHLDIVELFTRELNADREEIVGRLSGAGDTLEEARSDLKRKLARYHQKHVEEEIERRTELYDDETDKSRNRAKQEEWNRKLNKALAK